MSGYVAVLKENAQSKMCILHSLYGKFALCEIKHKPYFYLGAGALCSPFVATHFSLMPHWSFFYLTSLGIALANSIIILWVFGLKTQDGIYSLFLRCNGNTIFSMQSVWLTLGRLLESGEQKTRINFLRSCIFGPYIACRFSCSYMSVLKRPWEVRTCILDYGLSTNTYTIRLDSHFHHERTTWWPVIRICIVGFLWR